LKRVWRWIFSRRRPARSFGSIDPEWPKTKPAEASAGEGGSIKRSKTQHTCVEMPISEISAFRGPGKRRNNSTTVLGTSQTIHSGNERNRVETRRYRTAVAILLCICKMHIFRTKDYPAFTLSILTAHSTTVIVSP
jgi:hypothetical protein